MNVGYYEALAHLKRTVYIGLFCYHGVRLILR